MAPVALPSSRVSAPEVRLGILSDLDGRLIDWSAVAFGDEPEACQDMPAEQRLFCLAILVPASTPFVFVGAAARWMAG